MTDETKPEAMTAEKMADIRERVLGWMYSGPTGVQADVAALLSALEEARRILKAIGEQLGDGIHEPDNSCLPELVRGVLAHSRRLLSGWDKCARERDEERGQAKDAREARDEAEMKLAESEKNAKANLKLAEQRERERDEAIAASAETARKYAEAVERLRAARESLDRRDQRLADERTRVAELEGALRHVRDLRCVRDSNEFHVCNCSCESVRATVDDALVSAAPPEQAPAPPRTDDGARTQALREAVAVVQALREPYNSQAHAVEALEGLARAGATHEPPAPDPRDEHIRDLARALRHFTDGWGEHWRYMLHEDGCIGAEQLPDERDGEECRCDGDDCVEDVLAALAIPVPPEPPAIPWPVTANAMHACSVDFPDVESGSIDNVCGVFTVAECLTGNLDEANCLDCLRSIARQRGEKLVALRARAQRMETALRDSEDGWEQIREWAKPDHVLQYDDGDVKVQEFADTHRQACSDAVELEPKARPADVGAAPAASTGTAPKEPVCETCHDTHVLPSTPHWMCTRCPLPCAKCASGAFCATTPCACECHKPAAATGMAPAPVTVYCSPRVEERAAQADDDLVENGLDGKPFYVHGSECEGACDYGCSGRFVEPGPADAAPDADPLCARDIGGGRKCGHPLSVHRPPEHFRAIAGSYCRDCDCPGFVPPAPPKEKRCPCGLLVSCSAPESHRIGCPDLAKALADKAAAELGDGGTDGEPARFCPECDGRGRLSENKQCEACRGTGGPDETQSEPARTCETCNGYGVTCGVPSGVPCEEWAPKSGESSTEVGADSSGESGGAR